MKRYPTKPCLNCGGPASVRQGRWERTKYCSYRCGARMRGIAAGVKSSREAMERRASIVQPDDHRLIPLTRGGAAQVDAEDFEALVAFAWALGDKGYARRTVRTASGRKKNERLHRVVMERILGRKLLDREQVDHEDGDRLNNRRSNLRLATSNQNSFNTRRRTSLLRGVCRNHKRFCCKIQAYDQTYYIGTFDTPEEAGWMYDQWAIELHGQFALLNFNYV